jgi:hypothetical protein
MNSAKFGVASASPSPAPSTRDGHDGTASESKHPAQVAFVASCSERLRLVTTLLTLLPRNIDLETGAQANFVLTEFSEVQLGDGEHRSVRRVISSSCSHSSPVKE